MTEQDIERIHEALKREPVLTDSSREGIIALARWALKAKEALWKVSVGYIEPGEMRDIARETLAAWPEEGK